MRMMRELTVYIYGTINFGIGWIYVLAVVLF